LNTGLLLFQTPTAANSVSRCPPQAKISILNFDEVNPNIAGFASGNSVNNALPFGRILRQLQ
jgi:hypothetical protein